MLVCTSTVSLHSLCFLPCPLPRPPQEALAAQERLQAVNSGLQQRLAEYFQRKKGEEVTDPGRSVTDQEKRYLQCLGEGVEL